MPILVVCAACSARLNAPDSAAGRKVKCPKCQAAMVVPTPLPPGEPVFEVVEEPAKKPVAKPKVKADVMVDDDEDRPRKKRQTESDEDAEADRPKKKKKAAGNSAMTRNIIGGVVLLVLLGVAGWVYYDKFGKKDNDTAGNPKGEPNNPTVRPRPGPGSPEPKQPDVPVSGDPYDTNWRALRGEVTKILEAKAEQASADLKREGVEIDEYGYSVRLSAKFGTPDGKIQPEVLQKLRIAGVTSFSTMQDFHLSDAGMLELGQLRCLKSLDIREGTVTDAGLAVLKDLPSLDTIEFGGGAEKPLAITGDGFRHLPPTTKLTRLVIWRTGVTDDGLTRIGQISTITKLSLAHVKITDAGLAHLKGLNKLADLDLQENSISGTGLKELSDLQVLNELNLFHCPITDDGLAAIASLNVKSLRLQEAKVTDNGMRSLLKMTKLQGVSLVESGVTDEGLKILASHPNLEWLWLQDTPVTDDGLLALVALPKLKSIDVSRDGKITREGIAKFQKARPEVKLDVR